MSNSSSLLSASLAFISLAFITAILDGGYWWHRKISTTRTDKFMSLLNALVPLFLLIALITTAVAYNN